MAGGGGPCSTRFIIGHLQGFYMAHVAEPPHFFNSCGGAITVADLGGGGGEGLRGSNEPP